MEDEAHPCFWAFPQHSQPWRRLPAPSLPKGICQGGDTVWVTLFMFSHVQSPVPRRQALLRCEACAHPLGGLGGHSAALPPAAAPAGSRRDKGGAWEGQPHPECREGNVLGCGRDGVEQDALATFPAPSVRFLRSLLPWINNPSSSRLDSYCDCPVLYL